MKLRLISIFALLFAPSLAFAADAPKKDAPGAGADQDKVVVDDKTEVLLKGAQKWLASKQNANGSWSNDHSQEHQVAMTGYTIMAFLTCGQLPDEGEYGKNVTSGLNFLLSCVKGDGFIQASGATNMYEHGIASIALAEMYGQTKDARIKPKLESAIKLIINSQNNEGGWRYAPRINPDADISVTVLQVVALRAAKNSGIDIPQRTIDNAVKYVRSCYDTSSGGFTYQPRNRAAGFARTAAAIYSLQVCGEYDDKRVQTGAQYLFNRKDDREWFTYGNFYAAPAMYMLGGDQWKKWYEYMVKTLGDAANKQADLVYWEPKFDGGRGVGRIYCTAVYTSILAMPYHYVPLYQR